MNDDTGNVTVGPAPIFESGDGSPANLDRSGLLAPLQVLDESLQVGDALAAISQDIETYQALLGICCKLTRPEHWLARQDRHGGLSFSLQGPGAEALSVPFQVTWTKPEQITQKITDEVGTYYAVITHLSASSEKLKRSGVFIGYCDTRDEFFLAGALKKAEAFVRNEGGNPDRGRALKLAPCFVSIGDVMKSSFTNALVSAVTRMLGIRNPSRDILEASGLAIGRIPGVDYNPSQPGTEKPKGATLDGRGPRISDGQAKRLYAIVMEELKKLLPKSDHAALSPRAADILDSAAIAFGVQRVNDLSPAQYDSAEAKIREQLAKLRPGAA